METMQLTGTFVVALLAIGCAANGADLPEDSENGGSAGTSQGMANTGGVANATGGTAPTTGGTGNTGAGNVSNGGGTATGGSGGSTNPTNTGGTTSGTGGTPQGTGGTSVVTPTTCTATASSTMTSVGGYVTAGAWQGYAWTASDGVGTSANPADFSTLAAGSALCACGLVKGTTDYSGVAMIGINLNQPDTGGDAAAVVPSGTGITVSVSGAGTIPLRLQIQGPDGETDDTQRWCADLPSAGGTVAWSDFQFECWEGGMQTPFDGTSEIIAAMVVVPGSTTDIPFDFCVTSLSGG